MLQFPADGHDTELASVVSMSSVPGSVRNLPQWPSTSLTTNALPLPSAPPATQFPADPHDTESTDAGPTPFVVPGTLMAVPQVPFTSLTTNAAGAWVSAYCPPALQFPGDAQDTDRT